jgi:hypothetical protein
MFDIFGTELPLRPDSGVSRKLAATEFPVAYAIPVIP